MNGIGRARILKRELDTEAHDRVRRVAVVDMLESVINASEALENNRAFAGGFRSRIARRRVGT